MNAIQSLHASILNMMPKCSCGRPTTEVDMDTETAHCTACMMGRDYEKAMKARKPHIFN